MRVLYATDGSESANAAGEVIVAAADRAGVEASVLSVVATGMPTIKHLPEALRSADERREYARRVVSQAGERLRGEGFAVDEVLTDGRPDEAIAAAAERRRADLVAVGAGPRSTIVGRVLGSVTTALLPRRLALLVARDTPAGPPVRVVIGTDGSEHATRAVELAARFLDPTRCEVTVVSVAVLIVATPDAPYGGYATAAFDEASEREVTEPARQHVEQAAGILRSAGFAPHTTVVMGHPVKRLLGVAADVDASLVVVGRRGLSYPDRVFLGSVSDQIVRQAPATLVAG